VARRYLNTLTAKSTAHPCHSAVRDAELCFPGLTMRLIFSVCSNLLLEVGGAGLSSTLSMCST